MPARPHPSPYEGYPLTRFRRLLKTDTEQALYPIVSDWSNPNPPHYSYKRLTALSPGSTPRTTGDPESDNPTDND